MSNYYADAIDILLDDKVDFRALATEVAKKHPKAIVSAAKRMGIITGIPWHKACGDLMQAGKKIEAIKKCREATGMGLAEAKEAVEALAK